MPRRLRLLALAGALMITAGTAAVASADTDSHTELCGRYQTSQVKNGRYVVMNNVWGATTAQCIDVGRDGAFRVVGTDHRNTDATAAYPATYVGCHWGSCSRGTNLPLRVNEISSARSTWRIDTGAPGTWTATYDIWFHTSEDINRSPDGAELMIWLDHAGGANPSGKVIARNVRIAGALWDVWFEDSAWNYVAYVRTERTSAVRNLDLKAFTADAVGRGYIKPTWFLSGIEAGFEIWRDGTGLASTSFSATVARGPAAPEGSAAATPGSVSVDSPGPAKATPAANGPLCSVHFSGTTWDTGLVADVVVVNHGPPLKNWSVEWTFLSDEAVESSWGTEISQNGRRVVARNASYNGDLGTGANATFGFQASHRDETRRPTDFRLNGAHCTVE